MAHQTYQYTALITSLPKMYRWSHSERAPISAYRLDKLLTALDESDLNDLNIMVSLMDWSKQDMNQTDVQYLPFYTQQLSRLSNPKVREMIEWRLECRTIVAALRHKRLGRNLSELGALGHGRWLNLISTHWGERELGLGKIFPWVSALQDSLEAESPVEAEKIVLDVIWKWLSAIEFGHQFDFEAIAIYRMRWDIVNNWCQRQADEHTITFDGLLQDVLAKTV